MDEATLKGNPWGLSPAQCEICVLMIKHPTNKHLAKELGVSVACVADRTKQARMKMDASSNVEVAVLYDRWIREQANQEKGIQHEP